MCWPKSKQSLGRRGAKFGETRLKEGELQKQLPKIDLLPGSVCLQRVRCGKSNCRCASGHLHEAYYRFWREDGRLRKAYVRKRDLEQIRAACALWRECESTKKALCSGSDAASVWAQMRQTLRDAGVPVPRRMYKGAKGESNEASIESIAGQYLTLDLPSYRFGGIDQPTPFTKDTTTANNKPE